MVGFAHQRDLHHGIVGDRLEHVLKDVAEFATAPDQRTHLIDAPDIGLLAIGFGNDQVIAGDVGIQVHIVARDLGLHLRDGCFHRHFFHRAFMIAL